MKDVDTAAIAATLLLLACSMSQAASVAPNDLADLSLEELANIEITSVSRRAEPLAAAPASIFVITAEDVRRSGATSLPEALRLAPNLQVARLDAGQYAITARGFNNAIGNKLLVLIDGRTVYAPFFSGVLWDQQDVMLEDIERIEVISGPGGTLWGTNAVNGVINVVTRSASQTTGLLTVVDGGNLDAGVEARYGQALGPDAHFRVYAKASQEQNTKTAAGTSVADGWRRAQAGFRVDWAHANDGLMLQGNAFQSKSDARGAFGSINLGSLESTQTNLLGLWTRHYAGGSDIRVQAYYDHSKRDDALLYQPEETIYDLEFQHGVPLGDHRVVWGGGYRRAHDTIRPGAFFSFIPVSRTLSWANLFAQDEIKFGQNVSVTVGARFEHNDYSGTEVLPNLRWAWKFATDRLLWAAASRAVRAPARLDRDIRLPPTPPFIIAGGPGFVSEVANIYELGYRGQPLRGFNFSVTAFYQAWDKLRSGQTPPNAQVQNMIDGSTSGIEAWGSWQAAPAWRLSGGLTTLHKDLRVKSGSTDPVGDSALGNDPDYQWVLRSTLNLPQRQELDVTLRHVAELPNPLVPAYTVFDLRYGWHVSQNVEVSLLVRNLFDAAHAEFGAAPGRSEIARSALVQLRWAL